MAPWLLCHVRAKSCNFLDFNVQKVAIMPKKACKIRKRGLLSIFGWQNPPEGGLIHTAQKNVLHAVIRLTFASAAATGGSDKIASVMTASAPI